MVLRKISARKYSDINLYWCENILQCLVRGEKGKNVRMFNGELGVEDVDRDYEKKIENFAKDTLKEVEAKSKMFGITFNQVAGAMSVRK